jgi:hypothetical protein
MFTRLNNFIGLDALSRNFFGPPISSAALHFASRLGAAQTGQSEGNISPSETKRFALPVVSL